MSDWKTGGRWSPQRIKWVGRRWLNAPAPLHNNPSPPSYNNNNNKSKYNNNRYNRQVSSQTSKQNSVSKSQQFAPIKKIKGRDENLGKWMHGKCSKLESARNYWKNTGFQILGGFMRKKGRNLGKWRKIWRNFRETLNKTLKIQKSWILF